MNLIQLIGVIFVAYMLTGIVGLIIDGIFSIFKYTK